jgi:uncharacterized protein
MFVLDTNLLVYAADRDSRFHEASRALVEECRTGGIPWYVTWGILYEFLRVTTHPRVMRQPWSIAAATAFVTAVLASPVVDVLVPTSRHARVLEATVAELPHLAGNIVHDATTAVLMREHGIRRILTRDTHFHRFPFLEVEDPLG